MDILSRVGIASRSENRSRRHSPTKKRGPFSTASLFIDSALARKLLRLYDYPHPHHPGTIIRGYDILHALRTTRMCGAVAQELEYPLDRLKQFQIACLLHDLGRAGLDPPLFGTIWSWVKRQGIPTRPREWRALYPETPYGRETSAFLAQFQHDMQQDGIPMDHWAREQVEMRLGFARRLGRQLRKNKPRLKALGVEWAPWMKKVMLYYYYPEKLVQAPFWVHQLAEILVACEQLEAYSNHQRGKDYYNRKGESFKKAFHYLFQLEKEGILSRKVMGTICHLTAQGTFNRILQSARGAPFSSQEQRYLKNLTSEVKAWQ